MKIRWLSIVPLAALLLVGCPEPITESVVDASRDVLAPSIQVATPAEYAPYARTIVIAGSVSDLAGPGKTGRVESLTYEVLSRTAPKSAVLAEDGSFLIEEPNELRENIVVLLVAADWNGNVAEYRLPLTWPGNEIPSFAALEGNRQTTLSWDPVPDVVRYTLYVEPSAKTPDPTSSASIAGIASPYTLGSLKNASLYSFLLEGESADGRKNYSAVIRSLPLSTMHLLPRASAFFNGIDLTWRTFAAIQNYEVLRASAPEGPWESISGPIATPPYRDSSVVRGQDYFYAVRPAAYSAVRSEWVEARADPVASRSDAAISSYAGIDLAERSIWRDGYLYVLDWTYGLQILDVSAPAIPRLASQLALSSPGGIALQGDYAYVSCQRYSGGWQKGLAVIDVSDPAAPSLSGFAVVPNAGGLQSEGVAVLGNLVFMAGFNDGFAVVDVSDKAAPVTRISNRDQVALGQNYDVEAQERGATDLLAVAGNSGTRLYSVSGSVASPSVVYVGSVSYGRSLVFSGTVLYVAGTLGGWQVSAYQTSVPAVPVLLDSLDPSGVSSPASIEVDGERLFVAISDYGYAIIDAGNPADLREARVQTVPGEARHVAVGGGYVYVSAGDGYELPIYGASDPSAAKLALTLSNVQTGARLAAYRGFLYVSENGSGDWKAAAYDLGSPDAPFRSASTVGSYTPYAFAFAGERSFIAAERSGIMQWSHANPAVPSVLPPWYVSVPSGNAWAIALTGHYALVGTANSWVASVDLSRADSLTVVGSVQTQTSVSTLREVRGLALRGDLAFAANEQAGLRVVDVSDPSFPVALSGYGALPAGGSAAAVAMSGDFALVADSVNGLLVYDGATARSWSTGGQAQIWPTVPSGGGALDVAVRGNYAYVARGAAGLEIWDISNPRSPVAAGALAAVGFSPNSIVLYGDFLYALDGATKLYVVDLVP